jgi:predicted glycosyltransferase
MRNVVFLVKNGIGYGHIRRAILLARAVQEAGVFRPIIISQASTLDLYDGAGVRVVNFPLLHRVPSAVTEDRYSEILDETLALLEPAVVIEDTYPDPRYGNLRSLSAVPRILIMRRLDGASFDQLRTQ